VRPDTVFAPVGVVDVEVPQQYMVSRGNRNSSRKKGKHHTGVKWEGLIGGLVF
jgi:hypothetical protein